jgi:hypothetical protein
MERALREIGYSEDNIKVKMRELIDAFARNPEEGQAQWRRTRAAVLRRRQETEAHVKAEQVEAEAVKSFTERRKRSAPTVAQCAKQKYGRAALPAAPASTSTGCRHGERPGSGEQASKELMPSPE